MIVDKKQLNSLMALHGDTQADLASFLGLSLSRFNAKVNEYKGAAFTQPEMNLIIQRYRLKGEDATALFFPQCVACGET